MIVQFELELTEEELDAFARLCSDAGKTESEAARDIIIEAIGGEDVQKLVV